MEMLRRFRQGCGQQVLPALAFLLPLLVFLLAIATPGPAADQEKPAVKLELRPKDHISIIGNTLADRMQHDGWLETYLQSRFPKHDLVIRNLGFPADGVNLKDRDRSAKFGSPDEWLKRTGTDVVFAFFGYNESFGGEAGLGKFKSDLEDFIKNARKQKYNGKSAPRIVLFSPIAHEDLKDRNLPDGTENNKRLTRYTAAMAEVARANGVVFIDLFKPTIALYTRASSSLTINGIHLTEHGNEALARVIDEALFGNAAGLKRDATTLKKLRQAVLDKNLHWFNRYRTVDGYSIFGGRSTLRFIDGQTNYEVAQREMEVLDIMTANRDRRIWAVAQGKDLVVDDSNTPGFIPVKTNKPGTLPGGKHHFLDPEEAIKKMTVGKGMKVNLFASEKDWPELAKPVQMSWDTRGRLWVACWPTYPHWKPKESMNDKIIILEDTKGTGKADKMTVFADGLHCPTGFEFYNGGVLVAQQPDIMFLKDTTGGDKANLRVRVLSGIDSADTHHAANSFAIDPGGAVYFQEGTFHHTQVETPYGPPVRNINAGVYRYVPRTQEFGVYVAHNFANPHGHVFDRWGQDIVVDGTGAVPYHGTLFSGQTDFPQKHGKPPTVYTKRTRPCAGIEFLSSRHFPEANQGNLLVANVITFRGVQQYKIKDKGSSFAGTEVEPILVSSDDNFRPTDIKVGPDGAIYISDWQNPIIGHMQHNLRDPSRDRVHGRIYRVSYPSRPLLKPVKIAGESVPQLLERLKEPEDRVRYRARIELGGRPTEEVIAAVDKWTEGLDKKDPNYEHNMLEALWLHQSHNTVNEALLKRMLRSPAPQARAAATRVLCYWREKVKTPLELMRTQINDENARVRLEAIRGLSFFHGEEALGVALELLAHPDDEYLRYTFNETLNTLERRLGFRGSKIDRKNIAASMLRLLDQGKVAPGRRAMLLETVCRHASPKELQTVWKRALEAGTYPVALRAQVLGWLADAANLRRVRPTVKANEVKQLLATAPNEALPDAIRLASAWKMKESAGALRKVAGDKKANPAARAAAIDGLAVLGDDASKKALSAMSVAPHTMPIRFRSSVALAQVDLEAGATAAAAALAAATEADDPSLVVEAFLVRKGGPEKLAAALGKEKMKPDGAKRILRAIYLAGRNDAVLTEVVSRLAGLDAVWKKPTPKELTALAEEVKAKGDAVRGEQVFRRADVGCMKCHAVNKAGAHIGPDLGPVGGASPLGYIVESILDPSASIKEEYLTKVITTASGKVVTGIVVERTKDRVVLKDATGKRVKISPADIESDENGKSLMPEGVTRILTKGELLDLIRFVSDLGKPGPYAAPAASTVLRWKQMREVPKSLSEGIPNREVIREVVLRDDPKAWDVVYTRVNGVLPITRKTTTGKSTVVYLQSEVTVQEGGEIEVAVQSKVPVVFWIDEEAFEKEAKAKVKLTPGRHRITVRVVADEGKEATVKAVVTRAADSRARVDVVQSE